MVNNIIDFILNTFSFLKNLSYRKELLVFIVSILPISELRGGLMATSMLGLNPIPLVLLFFDKILDFFERKNIFSKFSSYLRRKVDKNKASIEKYGYLGLTIFVGIPLPGTGAWTGCLLYMDKKKSFIAILLGVVMASVIMMIVSFGILKAIF